MAYKFLVTVEVDRVQGKFAGRAEIEEAIIDALESADPNSIDGVGADGDSEYETTLWDVEVTK